ncbi:MAG: hypothetical protein ABEJ65_03225, partial [bacterium]
SFQHSLWLIGVAIGAVLVCGVLAQEWYAPSWLRTQEGRPRQTAWITLKPVKDLFAMLPNPYRPLMRKECLIFMRETSQWSQLLVLLGIVVVHLVNLFEIPTTDPFLKHVIYFFNIALIGFVITAVCVRFVFPSISFEGDQFWIIRTAPVSMKQFFLEKTMFYLAPIGSLALILIMATNAALGINWPLFFWAALIVTVIAITLTAGALAFGAMFPKFDFDHFGEVITSTGSVLYMLCGMFYVAGIVGLLLLPLYMDIHLSLDQLFFKWLPVAITFGSIVSILLTWFLLWLASRAIEGYEYSRI